LQKLCVENFFQGFCRGSHFLNFAAAVFASAKHTLPS
jgi:hypothetical protein